MNTTVCKFDWDIKVDEIFDRNNDQIGGYKVIRRDDNNQILTVCKHTYSPVTNESFAGTVNEVIEFTGYPIHKVVEYKNGIRTLVYLKAPNLVIMNQEFGRYMLIGNSHDASMSEFVGFVFESLKTGGQFSNLKGMRVYHTKNNKQRIREVKEVFNSFQIIEEEFKQSIIKFGNTPVTMTEIQMIMAHIFKVKMANAISTRKQNMMNQAMAIVTQQMDTYGKNALSIFYGILDFVSNQRTVQEKNKVFGNVFGTNSTINKMAYDFLLKVVNKKSQ